VKITGDTGVRAVAGAGDAVERLLQKVRGGNALGEGDGLIAEFSLGVDQDDFVDQILLKEGAVEVRATLEKEAENIAFGESGEDCREAEASVVVGDGLNLSAAFR
jgi:hypothetical protein